MGQSRLDRTWPAQRNTRFVYVLGEDQLATPVQGLVVAWSRYRYKWRALVVRVDDSVPGGRMVQDWLPLERLRPVRVDPNKGLIPGLWTRGGFHAARGSLAAVS